MRNICAAVVLLFIGTCAATAQAQNTLDDVYNWREPKADPGAPKRWPPYYKPAPMAPEHQLKYAMGWCRVHSPLNFRNQPTYTIKPEEIIDVNKLPETTVNATVAANDHGQLLVRSKEERFVVIVHSDPQLSQVTAAGEVLPEALKPGMFVSFSGKVSAQGEVSEVEGLQVALDPDEDQTTAIRADERQRVVARFASRHGDQLLLRIKGDNQPHLTVKLAARDHIALRASNCQLAAEGDEIAIKGRLYRDKNSTSGGEIFAGDVRLKLADPIVNIARGRRRPTELSRAAD